MTKRGLSNTIGISSDSPPKSSPAVPKIPLQHMNGMAKVIDEMRVNSPKGKSGGYVPRVIRQNSSTEHNRTRSPFASARSLTPKERKIPLGSITQRPKKKPKKSPRKLIAEELMSIPIDIGYGEEDSSSPEESPRMELPPLENFSNNLPEIILLQNVIRTWLVQLEVRKFEVNRITRKKIVEEIVQTEETYVSKLETLKTNFCEPLLQSSSKLDIAALNSQIQIILSYSQLLLQKLKKQLDEWADNNNSKIGAIFLEYSDFLKVYTQYVNYHTTLRKAISQEKRTNSQFLTLLTSCEKESQNQGINTFLILPIQRLPRYQMFLETLLKKTPRFHSDYNELKQALEKMISVTSYVDDREKEFEDIRKVLLVQEQIIGKCPWIALPHRKYVFEGQVTLEDTMKPRYWFLFNDIIISARIPKDNKYKFRQIIYLADLSVGEAGFRKGSNDCCVLIKDHTSKSRNIILNTPEEATRWENNLKALQKDLIMSLASMEPQMRRSTPNAPSKKRRTISMSLRSKSSFSNCN